MPDQKSKRPAQRLDRLALFQDFGYRPHPGQILVHRSNAKRRVLACAARWGKTTAAVAEAVAALLMPCESSLGWVAGPTFEHADRILKKTIEAIERACTHRIHQVDLRKRRFIVRNLDGGLSQVQAKTADQPTSLLGEGIDWLILDEAARVSEEIWTSHLCQRLVDRDGWSLLLSTPQGCNWFFREYQRGQKRALGYESWRSPSSENPHLRAELIEAERARLAPEVFDQEYGARFLGEELIPCEGCAFDEQQSDVYWHLGAEPEDILSCPECGNGVHRDGMTKCSGDGANCWYEPGPRVPGLLEHHA